MANSFRTRAAPVVPEERTYVDDVRSGDALIDGYTVLDQAPSQRGPSEGLAGTNYGLSLYGGSRNRQGLSEPVYDGPNRAWDE